MDCIAKHVMNSLPQTTETSRRSLAYIAVKHRRRGAFFLVLNIEKKESLSQHYRNASPVMSLHARLSTSQALSLHHLHH